MKELFLKYFGRLLAIIGCSTVVTACYGTPFEVYSAKGRVIDAETEEPIMGIKVQITPEGGYGITEANGSFEVRFTENSPSFYLKCHDIDGTENGSYESTKESLSPQDNQYYLVKMNPKK